MLIFWPNTPAIGRRLLYWDTLCIITLLDTLNKIVQTAFTVKLELFGILRTLKYTGLPDQVHDIIHKIHLHPISRRKIPQYTMTY